MSTEQVLRIAALVGLALIAGGSTAIAQGVTPMQAVVDEVGGKQVVAYYMRDGEACALTMMIDESPTMREARALPMTGAARLRVRLQAGESATLESVEGASIQLTCASGANELLVETSPMTTGIAEK